MQPNTLFRRFILQSIIAFLVTGALLAIFIMNFIVEINVNHSIEVVTLTFGHSLEHWFEEVDLHHLTDEDIHDLHHEFENLDELGNIADIRIWSSEGELLYSQFDTLIGTASIEEVHLEKAQENETSYQLLSKDDVSNVELHTYADEFIRVFLPVYHDHEAAGIFEVYRSFDSSRASINDSIRYVLIFLTSGLILLYALLAKTIYSSSSKLIDQKNELLEKNAALHKAYHKRNELYNSMIRAITNAIDARDKFTSGHSQRVSKQTVEFAKYLGMEEEKISLLEIAALLHDIGKLGVPEVVLNKTGRLTHEEYEQIQQHPIIGEGIITDITELHEIMDVIKFHHEKYSGEGYPTAISGKEIPLNARLIALTDAYDAMTSNRPYRNRLPEDVVIEEIRTNSGTQFDPELAEKFIAFLKTNNETGAE